MTDDFSRTPPGTDPAAGGAHWITVEEAAAVAEVTPASVVAWIVEGSIVSQTATGTDGLVAMVRSSDVMKRARRAAQERPPPASSDVINTPSVDLAPLLKSLPELINELVDAKERAAKAETKLEFMTDRLKEVRGERDALLHQLSSAAEAASLANAGAAPPSPPATSPQTVERTAPPEQAERGAAPPSRTEVARTSEGLDQILDDIRQMNDRIGQEESGRARGRGEIRPPIDERSRPSRVESRPERQREQRPIADDLFGDPSPGERPQTRGSREAAEGEQRSWSPPSREAAPPPRRPTLTTVEHHEDEDDIWDEGMYPDRRTRAASEGTSPPSPLRTSEETPPEEPSTSWNPAPSGPNLDSKRRRWWGKER